MKQVLVAAWVGIVSGWIGFGWVLAEAPDGDGQVQMAVVEAPMVQAAAVDILDEPVITARATEPNLRG